jgi:hypothetical protein
MYVCVCACAFACSCVRECVCMHVQAQQQQCMCNYPRTRACIMLFFCLTHECVDMAIVVLTLLVSVVYRALVSSILLLQLLHKSSCVVYGIVLQGLCRLYCYCVLYSAIVSCIVLLHVCFQSPSSVL